MKYPDTITCPRCGRENVKVNHDNEERMVTHLVPNGFMEPGDIEAAVNTAEAMAETSGRPAVIVPTKNRPRCRASSRRPENARIPGSLGGRGDLRLKR